MRGLGRLSCRVALCVFLSLSGAVGFAVQIPAQQKGGSPAGAAPPAAPIPAGVATPGGEPPLPPGYNRGGRCTGWPGGDILGLSKDPLFREFVENERASRRPSGDGIPPLMPGWAEKMRPFVPLLLEGLRSEDGCVQLQAIRYLAKVEDDRAAGPLLELVRQYPAATDVGQEALRTLARVFRDKRVVPDLVVLIEREPIGPTLAMAEDAANGPLKDERLWRALVRRFERTGSGGGGWSLVQAIINQTESVGDRGEVEAFIQRTLANPAFSEEAARIASAIGASDTFDEIARYYLIHCKNNNGNCWGMAARLIAIGGPKEAPFWLLKMQASPDAPMRTFAASRALKALAREAPLSDEDGLKTLAWYREHGGEALDVADMAAIGEILFGIQKAHVGDTPETKARFWEGAMAELEGNAAVCYWVHYQLYQACGPQGLADDARALAAISAAVERYPANSYSKVPPDWVRMRDVLRRKLRSQAIEASARIEGLAPLRGKGSTRRWEGRLAAPGEYDAELTGVPPMAYLEYRRTDGTTLLLPARVRFLPAGGVQDERLSFELTPVMGFSGDERAAEALRVLLLYLPREGGFSGAIASPWVPIPAPVR